jgi:type IV pilus assembly protein PilC
MPSYQYTARDERGGAVSGTLVAPNPESLADQLKRMGYLVTRSRELHDGATLETLIERWRGVGYEELVLFNVQLSKMVQVGIPLVTALDTLAQQTEHPRLRVVISDVARNVESGFSFSEALDRHPSIFSSLFINMVRAGEVSGKLDEILRRLAKFAKHQAELRQQLKTALTYPLVLLIVGFGAATFLIMGIIPKFMKLFLEADVPLPLPTQLLYQISQVLHRSWVGLIGLLVAIGWGLQRYARTPHGRRQFDTALLKIPVVGDLVRKAALSRMARTLETLFSSGVPVLESLSIAELTCGNTVIADACRAAQASVQQGGTISDPLRASREFPPMVVQMITVGESSGTLDHMLAEIAEHYDELIQHGLKRVTTLIEPVFLIVMGGMAAFIMASILLPLFRMVNVIR